MNLKNLCDPFPAHDIEWRVGSTNRDKTQGIALAYITNRAIMERLDIVCGPENWSNEYREWRGNSQLCGLSIRIGEEWVTKWDGAGDSQVEAVKGGLSDAMKRAGYQWGIGRYLYYLPTVWVPIKPRGKSYVLANIPDLPQWALPGGCGKPDNPTPNIQVSENIQTASEQHGEQITTDRKPGPIADVGRVKTVNTKDDPNGKWTKWGVLIDGKWYNTFEAELGNAAMEKKGEEVKFTYLSKIENGRERVKLLTIEPVVDMSAPQEPTTEDGLPF